MSWFGLDFSYSLLTRYEHARWEAGVRRDADGVRIGCREFTLGHGDVALLMVHGFADSPAVFGRMAPALAVRGFTCRAMRLPYFATPMDSFRRTSAAQWRRAVYDELCKLRERHGRVVVVAHSLGAAVALDCLAEHPDAADAAVLLAPLVEVSDRNSPLLPAEAWFQILDNALLFTDQLGLSDGGRDPQTAALMKTDAFVPRSVVRELFAVVGANRERARSVRVPLLMALGGRDDVVDNRAAERFFDACAARRKRLKYLPAAGHILPIERGWETLVGEIGRFVGDLPASNRL